MKSSAGFTLIELLVVIAIIGIIATLTFANFNSFSQAQHLNKAIGEIQSFLKLAQVNASSSALCGSNGGFNWIVSFRADNSNIDIFCGTVNMCGPASGPCKTLNLGNIQVSTITPPPTSPCAQAIILPLTITYAALTGVPLIDDSSAGVNKSCLAASQTLTVNLINIKNQLTKHFNISAGGAIDVQ